jgi:hypothetical protein
MIGYKYFLENDIMWRHHHHAIIPLSPISSLKKTNNMLAKQILNKHKALFIRWEEGFDLSYKTEWWHVIKDQQEDISTYSKNTRNQIRKGAQRFRAVASDKVTIANDCYGIYRNTFLTYRTFEKLVTPLEFRTAILELPEGTEFWLIIDKESSEKVGFAENLLLNDVCYFVSIWILQESKRLYAGYNLIHEMNKYYLNEIKVQYISDGARSITHDTNIQNHLQQKFKFRKSYTILHIVYAKWLQIVIAIIFPFRDIILRLPIVFKEKLRILLFQESITRASPGGQ